MSGLDAGVVGDWLAEVDDAPIPIPWRGKVYEALPPDGERGRRIAAFMALSRAEERTDEALEEVLQGEPHEVVAIGRETYDALVEAGMRPGSEAMKRVSTLCLLRWGYGSEDIARTYLEGFKAPAEQEPENPPAPKSRARSGRKTSLSTASASKTRSRAGSRTTSSPKE